MNMSVSHLFAHFKFIAVLYSCTAVLISKYTNLTVDQGWAGSWSDPGDWQYVGQE